MNILILGSGAREHAFSWKIFESKHCTGLFIAPGNAGTAQLGKNIDISPIDFPAIKKACVTEKIEMVFVGPEDPLVQGIYDYLTNVLNLNTKVTGIEHRKDLVELCNNIAQKSNFKSLSFQQGTIIDSDTKDVNSVFMLIINGKTFLRLVSYYFLHHFFWMCQSFKSKF